MSDVAPTIAAQPERPAPGTAFRVVANNPSGWRWRLAWRWLLFKADAQRPMAGGGPLRDATVEPGRPVVLDEIARGDWKERAFELPGRRTVLAVESFAERVGGTEPPIHHVWDLLSGGEAPDLQAGAPLPLLCAISTNRSGPADIDTLVWCLNTTPHAFRVTTRGTAVSSFDEQAGIVLTPGNRATDIEIPPGGATNVGEVARWEWYGQVLLDARFERVGAPPSELTFDLASTAPIKMIVPGVGIGRILPARRWVLPAAGRRGR